MSSDFFQAELDDDDEALGDDGDDGYSPSDMKIKSGVNKSVLDQVRCNTMAQCYDN
jgi:hypothetical protein